MNAKQLLQEEISKALAALVNKDEQPKAEDIVIEFPENLDHGDYSTNAAMVYYKKSIAEHRSPRDFATVLVERLAESEKLNKYIQNIEIAGPGFINFHLKQDYYIEMLNLINSNIDEFAKPKQVNVKASLEHTQMNPNKDLHVGHLRNSCIGDAVVNMLRYSGRDVIVQYYQNDAGLQISSIVLAYKEKFVDPKDFEKLHKWAAVAYVDIEKRIEEDTDLASKREQIQLNISKQENEDSKLAKELTDEILRNVLEIMHELDIHFDLIVCESEIIKNKLWETTFDLLKKSDSFYKAESGEKEGCWLVKMPNAEDKIFVRSNGVPNYVANDFAYELWKFGLLHDFNYSPFKLPFYRQELFITDSDGESKAGFNDAKEVYLVVDTTQSYPQQSIVEAFRELGYKEQSQNYHHVAYGFVYLSPQTAQKLGIDIESQDSEKNSSKPIKMSGRKGTVVSVGDFIKQVESSLVEKFGEFESLKAVRNGAIKFEMLKNNTYQDMYFDLDVAIDNKGFTGPYIQYTYARAVSILEKAGRNNLDGTKFEYEFNELEQKLLKTLNKLPEILELSLSEIAPHYLCHYMYEVAQIFNTFYNSNKVIGSDAEVVRLQLTRSVANTLSTSLRLVGIEAPARV